MGIASAPAASALLAVALAPAAVSARAGSVWIPRHGDDEMPSHAMAMDDKPWRWLNETDILLHHAPDPLSYYEYDFSSAATHDTTLGSTTRHGGLMISHAILMTLAYFVVLPMVIILRSKRNHLLPIARTTFWSFVILGWSLVSIYKRLTPDLYAGSTHGSTATILLVSSIAIQVLELSPTALKRLATIRHSDVIERLRLRWSSFWHSHKPRRHSLLGSPRDIESPHELLMSDVDNSPTAPLYHPMTVADAGPSSPLQQFEYEEVALSHPIVSRSSSLSSDSGSERATLVNFNGGSPASPLVEKVVGVLERVTILAAWGQVLTGLAIYFGACRQNYVNGCAAHLIKGSALWWYGILTFARYCGAWAEQGWAWNLPSLGSNAWSAPFVESLFFFIYGFMNQFLERLGKHPGDPYTAKDIEHISIAVLFWTAGLVGMAVETKFVRRLISSEDEYSDSDRLDNGKATIQRRRENSIPNPLPGLVVGVVGISMSAHHQRYVFQVAMHTLWGNLLLGFAICRALTCFLQWVHPRITRHPAHPPTELLGSIFLAAGGMSMIFSTEQIGFWAMRHGKDDIMMWANVALAFTCLCFLLSLLFFCFSRALSRTPH